MILPRYQIGASTIAGAGKGLFLQEDIARGRVIIAPDNVHTVWPEARLRNYPDDSLEVLSSVRWFECEFSLTPEWSDECYVNHAFAPNALWHLGFIFALDDLRADTEVTVDYRLVIGDGEKMPFRDGVTGNAIVGLPWAEALACSTAHLARLFPLTAGTAR